MAFATLYQETLGIFRMSGKHLLIPMLLGGIVVITIPIFHFGILYKRILLPESFTSNIDMYFCSNTCWDTVFKVGFEKIPAGYKHVYFNVTTNSMMIWIITVTAILGLYESAKYLFKLYFNNSLRIPMLALFLLSLYSHYYTWWAYFNYINDDYYAQWMHQLLFSITELVSSVVILHLCDQQKVVKPHLLLVIMNIASFHVLASCWDQFVSNVILQEGDMHQWTRDLAFMIPDILNIAIPLCSLWKMHPKTDCSNVNLPGKNLSMLPEQELLKMNDFFASLMMVFSLLILSLLF